jgi:hypothetical protein
LYCLFAIYNVIQATIRPGTPSPKAMMELESRPPPGLADTVGVGVMSGFTVSVKVPLVVRVALGDEVVVGVGALPELGYER